MDTLQTDTTRQPENPAKLATLAKCAHPGCTCTVVAGENYCSDYCLQHVRAKAADDDDGCTCGHPECASTAGGAVGKGVPPVGTITG